ncbi:hypothetical protein GCM10023185_03310 [Hymenobacter saemangeumensis]|uniref:Secreted protein n=1 Tax=Hymenobacter saemangeumensis TaxID=1084522 RepID=A0ABP8HZ53_9BACT
MAVALPAPVLLVTTTVRVRVVPAKTGLALGLMEVSMPAAAQTVALLNKSRKAIAVPRKIVLVFIVAVKKGKIETI